MTLFLYGSCELPSFDISAMALVAAVFFSCALSTELREMCSETVSNMQGKRRNNILLPEAMI